MLVEDGGGSKRQKKFLKYFISPKKGEAFNFSQV